MNVCLDVLLVGCMDGGRVFCAIGLDVYLIAMRFDCCQSLRRVL